MAATYSPGSIGIKAPAGGFQEGGWYGGRQYIGGTLSDPGVIHPGSSQIGAGQLVSKEVNLQSDAAQGNKAGDIEKYLAAQRTKQASTYNPTAGYSQAGSAGAGAGFDMTGGAGLGIGAGAGMGLGPTINLPELYKGLYESSGVKGLQEKLSEQEKAMIEDKGALNDNPFLSEATRVGRVAKLEELFGERTANLRGDIATQKADIETKLNLEMKQFDINSDQAKAALDQFNNLLSMGALNGASGEDIAGLTRATGLSSTIIKAAIGANKQKNVRSQLITSTDDNGNVTASVVDLDSGQIISQNSLGAIGNKQSSGGGRQPTQYEQQTQLQSQMVQGLETVKNSYGHVSPQDWQGALASWISRGGDTKTFISNFSQYADPNRGDFSQAYGFKRPNYEED